MNTLAIPTSEPSGKDPVSVPIYSRADWTVCLLLALVIGFGSWHQARRVPIMLLDGSKSPDIYFSADCSRVHGNMFYRLESNHRRTNVHPLFSITMYPLARGVAFLTGNDVGDIESPGPAIATGRVMSGLASAIAAVLFYLLLRAIGTRIIDSLFICALGASSAFAIFWFSVPETYPWGAISILFALLVSALGSRRKIPLIVYALASLGTFAITLTNWSVGLLATWTRFPWKKAFLISMVAFSVACALSITQKLIFPSSWFFFNIQRESNYVMEADSGGPPVCMRSALFHTIVMPAMEWKPHPAYEGKMKLLTQAKLPGSGSKLGIPAAGLWIVLFSAGVMAFVRDRRWLPFRLTLGGALLGQLVLHSVYGSETFLYCAHFGPMMLIPLGYLTQTKLRLAALVGIALLFVLLVINNGSQFTHVMEILALDKTE